MPKTLIILVIFIIILTIILKDPQIFMVRKLIAHSALGIDKLFNSGGKVNAGSGPDGSVGDRCSLSGGAFQRRSSRHGEAQKREET
jgi:hypothetical protein